ncbi:hypothetical protein FSARC_7571 [Fusarium sarcochroum]|uniref:Chromo domain-containing protein n=1 Tax=Fusarium sarcochroum TaxID=1208366 RepID=A0A8H4TUZ5_9HYPO|nr:hypothetical protein FSARC_7571 [Fusarium sarcochroum]
MTSGTPSKDRDVLVNREKPDGIKASPALRSGTPRTGTPRTGTPRVGTPRTGTPRGTPKVSTPKTGTPAKEKKPATPVDEKPAERAEPKSEPKTTESKTTEQNGEALPNGDAPEKVNPGFREDVEIDEFTDHRVDANNSTVDIKVKWEGGEETWESEWALQEQVPALVFKYWEKQEGGRETATNLDIYHVFRILKRTTLPGKSKGTQYMYQVQWVGYRPADSTWEHESKLRTIAPGELEKFEAKQLASAAGDKRKTTRGPGRPRKKARVED